MSDKSEYVLQFRCTNGAHWPRANVWVGIIAGDGDKMMLNWAQGMQSMSGRARRASCCSYRVRLITEDREES